jgi:alpha-beta hydrolase superfamily lysophospholipase
MIFETSSSQDKTIKYYEKGFHNLFVELPEVKDEVITETIDWIEERI